MTNEFADMLDDILIDLYERGYSNKIVSQVIAVLKRNQNEIVIGE